MRLPDHAPELESRRTPVAAPAGLSGSAENGRLSFLCAGPVATMWRRTSRSNIQTLTVSLPVAFLISACSGISVESARQLSVTGTNVAVQARQSVIGADAEYLRGRDSEALLHGFSNTTGSDEYKAILKLYGTKAGAVVSNVRFWPFAASRKPERARRQCWGQSFTFDILAAPRYISAKRQPRVATEASSPWHDPCALPTLVRSTTS